MNKFIFDFGNEILEYPCYLLDSSIFLQKGCKFEYNNELYTVDEIVVKNLKEECESFEKWDKESERTELLATHFKMKKI